MTPFILVILALSIPQFVIAGHSTSTSFPSTSSSSTTTSPQWTDPSVGGKFGNPGARIHVSNKSIDAVHVFASDSLIRALQSIVVTDLNLPIGPGVLTIKPPRVTEVKLANFEHELITPNRIWSHFYGGRILANGSWQYKSIGRPSTLNGTFKATITNADLNTTTQLSRNYDAKPTAQTLDCKSYLGQFKIDIDGANNLTTIENCYDPICNRIRAFYEDAVCIIVRTFVKEVINRKLATFPARVNVKGDNYKLDYGLLYNEPKIVDSYLQAALEGKFIWRGSSYVPYSPNQLNFADKNRMVAFELSDYTFNSLLHQSHSQGYGFSAAKLLSNSPSIQQNLALNCSNQIPIQSRKGYRVVKTKAIGVRSINCLGSVLDNVTSIGDFGHNATGDLIYKSNKAPSVIVQSGQRAFFDASNGVLEIWGPANGQNDQRQSLGKVDVRVLRGEFVPKFVNGNITGSIKITTLQLDKPTFGSIQSRMVVDSFINRLTQFATPILTEMFNSFFKNLAQFPVPLLDGFECKSPDFSITARTMQVNCDI